MSNLLVYRTLLIKFAFSSLLIFLHFLYAFYSWLVDQTIFKQPDPWQNRSINGYKKYRLKKLPNHLVVSVCQEEVFYEYLAKLLAWALFLEVPVVSFYHNENGISPEELFFAFRDQYSSLLTKVNWGLEFNDNIKFESKKCINGYKWEPRIEVNILTSKHSKLQLVNALRTVCRTEEEFSDTLVEFAINKTFPMVEPDLVVICGKSCTTFGLLPWHTRVTEFLTLKTHYNVTFLKFYKLLEQYSRNEQRFGK
ncbi:dehydrodolichyl diphosphate synthase complex subunit nus1 [Myzus persicae]|uniref:dehydrodolichyl diphosphate synthase complex subunit nus1 n=1 Tax=Myzus persicae TaxID=13164 RepID=UPI000B931E0F|nr:dehydrodolichyl diphosphate synthase complex subunit nus1 [Myzus persicae]